MAESTDDIRTEVESAPAEIRAEMDDTRFALTEKLEALEGKVVGTVQAAQSTVQETISNVKETVHQTVQTVKRTFDVRLQTQQRPWLMVGGAVAAGFALGKLVKAGHHRQPKAPARLQGPHNGAETTRRGDQSTHEKGPGVMASFMDQFGDEVRTLRGAAIGAVMGIVRDFVKDTLPAIAPQVDRAMNSATTKLGGEPIHRDILTEDNVKNPITQPTY